MSRIGIDQSLLWRKLFAFDESDIGPLNESSMKELQEKLQSLDTKEEGRPLRAMVVQRLAYWLRADIVPTFHEFFTSLRHKPSASYKKRRQFAANCVEQMTLAMQFATDAMTPCQALSDLLPKSSDSDHGLSVMEEVLHIFRGLVFEELSYKQIFIEVIAMALASRLRTIRSHKTEESDLTALLHALWSVGWSDLVQDALDQLLRSQLEGIVSLKCGDSFTETYLTDIQEWVEIDLHPWIYTMCQTKYFGSKDGQEWKKFMHTNLQEMFARKRITQLFDIIKEFPESVPALEELAECLESGQLSSLVIESFSNALRTRLLHPGTTTAQILDIYILTIKAFRIIDRDGVLLEHLGVLFRQYLLKRKDTVRCIVSSLTEEEESDLYDELRRTYGGLTEQDDDSDDDEEGNPDEWEPDPIEAEPGKTTRSRRSNDILQMLVNIYGSRELFVNEYRMMLADKLLQNLSFDTSHDVATLELLKLRFGEELLKQGEIMVRDIDDSKRLNTSIQEAFIEKQRPLAVPIDATIVSHEFWPRFKTNDFALPPQVKQSVDMFQEEYNLMRKPRSLDWKTSLGSVQVEIELEGTTREFTVSPLQASIIVFFDEKDNWSTDDLSTRLEITTEALVQHASVWVNCGILVLSSDRSELMAASSFRDREDQAMVGEMVTAVSSDAQAEEDLRVFESYIVGMLTNFGSLSLQRIHNMLSSFARTGAQPYNKTISGLSAILGKLVDNGRLEVAAGEYRLAR